MIKYQVGTAVNNKIDLCGKCDEAWLDSGEWRLLCQLDLHNKLPQIFTDAWQRNIRQERSLEYASSQLATHLGEENAEEVGRFADWLEQSEKRREVMDYLQYRINLGLNK